MQIQKNPLHLVSMDEESFVKVWDIQRLKCVYTISLKQKENLKNAKFNVGLTRSSWGWRGRRG